MKNLFLLCVTIFLLSACSHKEEKVSYLAFKSDIKDRWGLIDLEGKILFENEFQEEPTAIMNGRFFLKNSNGLYECYTIEAKPQKIGKEYVAIQPFIEDVTPVVEKDQPISFIDKSGKTVFTFDKYENKAVMSISNFIEGLAVFRTEDNLYGYVNTKGEVVIKPQYTSASIFQENIALITDKNDKKLAINRKGEILFDIHLSQICTMSLYHNGMLLFCNEDDFDQMGCLNNKGEKVIKPSSRINKLRLFEGEAAPFQKDGYWGFIDKKGEVLVRAKYQDVDFYNSDFACVKDKEKWGIIDYNGEILCNFEYDKIYPFYNREYAYARSHDYYVLIDKTGKEISKKEYAQIKTDYFTSEYPERMIESDYLDYEAALRKELNIALTGIDGVSFKDSPEKIFKDKNQYSSKEDYKGSYHISYDKDTKYFYHEISCYFPEMVVTPIKERVNYGWGFYDEEIKGYNFNNKQSMYFIEINTRGKNKASEKYVNIINAIENIFVGLGFETEKRREGSPVLLKLDNAARAVIYKDNNNIKIEYTCPTMSLKDEFWEEIKNQNYETKYNLSAEERARNTADSIRIADSIAAVEAAAKYSY
ncbi:WG repeat-containing protein [Bacteroides zhangwenhongii]|uniref:WG repeat-containing protein n=1 Tax=Bacteroides zhangwenhongii TaxID=2650157 RepID=UPI003AAB77D7